MAGKRKKPDLVDEAVGVELSAPAAEPQVEASETAPKPVEPDSHTHYRVKLVGPHLRYRGGRRWKNGVTFVPLADLTPEQVEEIQADSRYFNVRRDTPPADD